jgi:phage terminase small subunit
MAKVPPINKDGSVRKKHGAPKKTPLWAKPNGERDNSAKPYPFPMNEYEEAVQFLTAKQALFVKHYLSGQSNLDAFTLAGYSVKNQDADGLKTAAHGVRKKPKVAQAIATLQGLALKDSEVTREKLVQHMLDHRQMAIESGQVAAANQSVMGIARLMGLDVKKTETNVNHTFEAEAATQELYNMLHRRDRLPKPPTDEVVIEDAIEVEPDLLDEIDGIVEVELDD